MSFGFFRQITIDHTKVGTVAASNYPVGLIGTYAWLATVANGGRVQNASGYDVKPYSDTALTSARTYQLVRYNATTGKIKLYWNQPTLSNTVDDVNYLAHGDSTISTDGSSTSTWNSGFKAVYDFGDGTTLDLTDKTVNGNTLSNIGGATAANGPIVFGAVSLNGTSQNLETAAAPVTALPVTLSYAFNPTGTSGDIVGITQLAGSGALGLMQLRTSGAHRANPGSAANAATLANSSITQSAWNYVSGEYASQTSRTVRGFNGSAFATPVSNANDNGAPGTVDVLSLGARHSGGVTNNFANTILGTVRVSNVARGNDWFIAEANNLLSPSTFYAVGTEQVAGGGNTAPNATITGPVAGGGSTRALVGTVVNLTGTGTDTEDGTLTGGSLVWTSSIDGALGTGVAVSPGALSLGVHTITLTATDAGALTDTDTITLWITTQAQKDWQDFIDANGGDADWLAAADFQTNVTDDGTGKASQWDDLRTRLTSGTKLVPLTQATQSMRYAITGSGLVGTAGAQSHMLSALDTRLGLSQAAGIHAIIFTKAPSANSYLLGISQDPTDTTSRPYLYARTNAADYAMQFNPASTNVDVVNDAGTPFDATLRAVLVGREQTHPTLGSGNGEYCFHVAVLGRMFRRQTGANQPTATGGGMKVSLGRFGGTYAGQTVVGFALTKRDLSATLIANLNTFVNARYGATLDSTKHGTIAWHGTSTDRGHNTTHPKGFTAGQDGTTSAPYICAVRNSGPGPWAARNVDTDIWALNQASNGNLLSDQVGVYSTRYALETASGRTGPMIYVIGGLLGEVLTAYTGVGGDTAYIAAITSFVATLHAAGIKVLIRTVMDYSGFYTGAALNQIGSNMVAVNAWIRNPAGAGALAGFAGCLEMERQSGDLGRINRPASVNGFTFAYQDTAYFDGTGHPTDAMQTLMGNIERDFFDANPTVLQLPSTRVGVLVGASRARRSRQRGELALVQQQRARRIVLVSMQSPGIAAQALATLPSLTTASATATVLVAAQGAATMPALVGAGTAVLPVQANAVASLPALSASAAGTLLVQVNATATMPALSAIATVHTADVATVTALCTMPALSTVAATVAVLVAAQSLATLPALAAAGTAVLPVVATSVASLPVLSAIGAAKLIIAAAAVAFLPLLRSVATGLVGIDDTAALDARVTIAPQLTARVRIIPS